MRSKATDRFWKSYDELPVEVKKQARDAYRLFQENPYYPSLPKRCRKEALLVKSCNRLKKR